MKVNFSPILLGTAIVIFGSLMAGTALAQDENSPVASDLDEINQTEQLNLTDDKILIFEHESRSARNKDSSHVHVSSNPVVPASSAKPKTPDALKPSTGAKEDDDVLSFNFLYYIIEKFKISDLIDE